MDKQKNNEKKSAPILIQMGIFACVLFVSSLISPLFPANFPVPTPVIGLVLLYLLLTFHIVKLEWVDNFGGFMISLIGFLFVPSGVSLASSLDIMKSEGLQIVSVVIISTVLMLVVTAYTAWILISLRNKISKRPSETPEEKENELKRSVN
ncbi:effector of murein hydrolase LrgA [Paucilactobacillus hokkaidonensis JCM 18461]|uniref:Effector of murein hydrolase LrgA n=2 Tax=Paucilactobacillus hokkaidonensis TaxID=1193095 RepID=A0A0A1H1W2_9LACO|nr:CidA/LrgA family protein [Paucilactobacillus hokkaidonensis]KRO09438.1 effector of murein hydrolase LrgA [Paucilactobacillus hokkaidonensis]BAP86686.1 effector of murein hydrolase LrgA [Paucilactobacillus hokkaidonensis JCM 18461]